MRTQQGFVRGAMLLAGAAMVTKLLGSVYTIVLQNVIGDHGMGIFQMAYPIYATLLAVATAGFPVAISKLVSEQLAFRRASTVSRILRVSMLMLTLAGILSFAMLFLGANMWARIAGDASSETAIRAIAPALLLVPLMSALRGYFQGYQQMQPTAASQIIEQIVRVATILGLAVWMVTAGYGASTAAAGAAFGAVTGAAAGLILLVYYWITRRPHEERVLDEQTASYAAIAKRLLYYAFPISLGAMIVPLMNNMDVITVVNLLKAAGHSQARATTEFGLLSGRAFKLMMLPTTLASGIGIAVMPAVSEAVALGFRRLVSTRIDTAIRLTMMLALPSAIGLFLLAKPIDIALFRDGAGAMTIQVIAIATVFASIQLTVAAVLQGSGWMYTPVLNLGIAALVKLAGNLIFVPRYGIHGAALATVVSYATAAWLNFLAMRRFMGLEFSFRRWVGKPMMATFVMAAVVFAMMRQWQLWNGLQSARIDIAVASLIMITVGMLVYIITLIISGGLTERELESIPKVGPRLISWCARLGLIDETE